MKSIGLKHNYIPGFGSLADVGNMLETAPGSSIIKAQEVAERMEERTAPRHGRLRHVENLQGH